MGFLSSAFRSIDSDPASGAKPVGGGFLDFFYGLGMGPGGSTLATAKTALTISAFFCGVETISADVAMLPKAVFKKDGDRREKQNEHPVNRLIALEPERLMHAFDFWKLTVMHAILKGECFALISRNSRTGVVENLYFYEKSEVTVREKDRRLWYTIGSKTYSDDDVLHFKGFTLDGKKCVGVVTYAAAQLGVNLESQAYAAEVYKNRGLSHGVIQTEKSFTTDADQKKKKAIAEGLNAVLAVKNPHRVAVLDDGFEYKTISLTPQETYFLETNKQGVLECCRWLNIAPHKLKELSEGTYSNIYQQEISHVQSTLMRWIVSWELELNRKCFGPSETDFYTKFNVNFLLRGDLQMKKDWYSAMIYAGVFNRNEVRAFEDMNPVDGLNDYLQPTNMQTLEAMMENLKKMQQDAGN